MPILRLFVASCILAGIGGLLGSIVGHAVSLKGLFIGGVVGGVVTSALVGPLAVWRRWIAREDAGSVALGASLGFLASAVIAVNTLSTPIGPVLSTMLVGVGALAGRSVSRARHGLD